MTELINKFFKVFSKKYSFLNRLLLPWISSFIVKILSPDSRPSSVALLFHPIQCTRFEGHQFTECIRIWRSHLTAAFKKRLIVEGWSDWGNRRLHRDEVPFEEGSTRNYWKAVLHEILKRIHFVFGQGWRLWPEQPQVLFVLVENTLKDVADLCQLLGNFNLIKDRTTTNNV